MPKQFKLMLLANIFLILFFVLTSYSIANDFNSSPNDLLYVKWNFFGFIHILHSGYLVNGNYYDIGADRLFIDFPFWLFFVTVAVNMYFMFKLQRSNETKQNS